MWKRLKAWAALIKLDVVALYLAARDPRVPALAKMLALATAAYALSPIDLIPDFIPVLGYLDDLILLPLAIRLAIRCIPATVMADLRRKAHERLSAQPPRSRTAAFVIILVWILLGTLATARLLP